MRLGLLVFGEHPPQRLVALARMAEDLGYDYFWCADEKFYRDPFVSLTLLALNTQRLKLGIAVTEPYARHPGLIAMAVASLAEVAPGRVVLGLGAGGAGFPEMGIKRARPSVALREAIEIVRRMLAGETVEHRGQVVSLHQGRLSFPSPGQVPIILGTRSERTLQLAGEVADGVMVAPYASAAGLSYALGQVQAGAQRAGRGVEGLERIARVDLCIATDGAVARETVKPGVALALWTSYPSFRFLEPLGLPPVPPALLEVLARRDYSLVRPNAALAPDAYVRHLAVAGTLEEVVAQMTEIARTGVNQITIYPVPPPGEQVETMMRAFAQEVMPAVRERVRA